MHAYLDKTCIHTNIMHSCMHTYVYVNLHIYNANTLAFITYIHVLIHICMYTYKHAYIYKNTVNAYKRA